MASLSQGRTAAAQCGLFTYKSVPVIFEPPCSTRFEVGSKNNEIRSSQPKIQVPRTYNSCNTVKYAKKTIYQNLVK